MPLTDDAALEDRLLFITNRRKRTLQAEEFRTGIETVSGLILKSVTGIKRTYRRIGMFNTLSRDEMKSGPAIDFGEEYSWSRKNERLLDEQENCPDLLSIY